ncbi:HEC/Ndc80p family protein [Colletotrichum orchidophilum]|uniref:Probable kinetochore protein NDC80 n=1 Tax=Colletotrichum orchidophilum TaxID=1209926 RepID=A0A1G4BG24_9PEZI|nr:HEC/Ndc80p family protein [Colletotrichum orchidophilum]OHF00306.1 HEC/Ndc80p family protein [Colletotrichum orchidophilum]
MSQDTGLWSVRRPRETLGGINYNTGLPQPASAMKRSASGVGAGAPYSNSHGRSMSGSRQSLALSRPSQPMFQRSSSGTNLADIGLSSVKRTSSMRDKSFAPTPAPGRSSQDDRRSSVYRARTSTAGPMSHQSFFQQAPQPAGVPRDPRPLRDRSYQARIGQELLDYLAQNNFEMQMKHTLSQNIIKSPTQKDFNFMFQWLYRRIDPSHKFQKNIDQEVPPILKQLRYPYERSITKSQIAAVGGQNWSTFLGLLHWMMQLAQMLDGYACSRYDDACLESGIDVTGDRIIFDFLSKAYRDWLAMDEDADDEDANRALAPHIERMAAAFEQSNSKYTSELEMLEAENSRLLQEIEDLEKSTPDPAVLDNHFRIMEEDKIKFEEYNALAMQRSDKYETRINVLHEELDKLNEELREVDDERRGLQKAVDDLGISMQDIDRMTAERERLQKGIDSASQRLEDVKKKVAEKEVEASRKLDELERMVDRYNTLAYQIALIPATAVNANGRDYELQVTVNDGPDFSSSQLQASSGVSSSDRLLADPVAGYQPAHILNLDLRGQVKNSFLTLRKEISERRTIAMDMMMKDHDLLDGIKEAIEDKRNEVEALEHRVRAAEEEYEKTKEVTTTQKMASDAQIEKMEKELAKMRATLSESVQLMEQREMNTSIEYEQLVLRANSLREELHTEIDRMLNDVIKFKIHVQKNLDDYEGFVADEVQAELGSEEASEDTRNLNISIPLLDKKVQTWKDGFEDAEHLDVHRLVQERRLPWDATLKVKGWLRDVCTMEDQARDCDYRPARVLYASIVQDCEAELHCLRNQLVIKTFRFERIPHNLAKLRRWVSREEETTASTGVASETLQDETASSQSLGKPRPLSLEMIREVIETPGRVDSSEPVDEEELELTEEYAYHDQDYDQDWARREDEQETQRLLLAMKYKWPVNMRKAKMQYLRAIERQEWERDD